MRTADVMTIEGHQVIEFRPGDAHIMIENMPQEAREGYHFAVTLVFERSGEKQIELTFLKTPKPSPMTHGDGKKMTVTD